VSYRLLALDIDGTLLGSDKKVSARTRRAVDAARAQGVRLVLVTGRRPPAARRVAEELGGRIPMVLNNGALILEDGALLRCRPLAREAARLALLAGRAAGDDAVVHSGLQGEGQLVVEAAATTRTLLAYYLDRSHPDVRIVPDLVAWLAEDPVQVMFGGTIAAMDALLPRLRAELGQRAAIERTVYPHGGVGLLDVLQPGVGKAEALAFLQQRWGIRAPETVAIGDNWNDHAMLEAAGLGLVMGNADPEMHKLGLPVLPSNDDDGVAVAIEQHLLRASA
jgi:Cof subfamily protein (haloacid dehalogenase superfamily)